MLFGVSGLLLLLLLLCYTESEYPPLNPDDKQTAAYLLAAFLGWLPIYGSPVLTLGSRF